MRANSHAGSWLFPQDAVFPVVSSDLHPLKLHSRGLMARGILSAVVVHFLVFGTWIVQRALMAGDLQLPPASFEEVRIKITDILPPPPIAPEADQAQVQAVARAEVPDASGVPEPVPDFQAPDVNFQPSKPDSYDPDPNSDGPNVGQDGPIVIVPETEEAEPDPRDFRVVEEEPYAVQNPAPVYPEMARAAEVEGAVTLRVLVSKEGRVKKVIVVSGHPMLDDAAVAAVRLWVFRPGMQQHRPVEVWVNQTIRFTLH
jgi:TonB family protein